MPSQLRWMVHQAIKGALLLAAVVAVLAATGYIDLLF